MATSGADFGVKSAFEPQILKNVKICNFCNQRLKFNNFLNLVWRPILTPRCLNLMHLLEIVRATFSKFCFNIEILDSEFPRIFNFWRKIRIFWNFRAFAKIKICKLILRFKFTIFRTQTFSCASTEGLLSPALQFTSFLDPCMNCSFKFWNVKSWSFYKIQV